MVASFNPQARLPKGAVTVRDIAGLYIYENTLVVLEVTGQVLKDALEHSARYFRAYEAGLTPAELVDEKIPAYNFDIAEGVTYDLDLTKPFGSRVRICAFAGNRSTRRGNSNSRPIIIASTAGAATRCSRARPKFIVRARRFAN
jgi:2',3'-cyclic-nucleotide 2'-phosphodiesterase/3'-nucleotidase